MRVTNLSKTQFIAYCLQQAARHLNDADHYGTLDVLVSAFAVNVAKRIIDGKTEYSEQLKKEFTDAISEFEILLPHELDANPARPILSLSFRQALLIINKISAKEPAIKAIRVHEPEDFRNRVARLKHAQAQERP